MSSDRSWSLLVHGGAKVGKTRFGDTAPAPRLVLDAEGGWRFVDSVKTRWDPQLDAPPAYDGTWDTCIVTVRDYATVQRVYEWLASGQHPFNSVIMDSISEIQQRCVDALVGADQMKTQDWGELLRKMSALVRQFRDLTFHPTKPLEAVIIIAMTRQVNDVYKAYVQGQLATTLPFYVDTIGYLYHEADATTGEVVLKMLVADHAQFEAGDRTGRLGTVIEKPNVVTMLNTIFGTPE